MILGDPKADNSDEPFDESRKYVCGPKMQMDGVDWQHVLGTI